MGPLSSELDKYSISNLCQKLETGRVSRTFKKCVFDFIESSVLYKDNIIHLPRTGSNSQMYICKAVMKIYSVTEGLEV